HPRPFRAIVGLVLGLASLVLLTLAAGPHAPRARARDEGRRTVRADAVKERVEAINKLIGGEYESLEKLYKHLHANPELSYQEVRTSARMAQELKALGWEV